MTLGSDGQYNEAEELFVQVIETRKRVLGDEHPSTLTSMANLASTFWNQGRWKEAEELQAKELGICSRVLGDEHPDTLTSMNNLAFTLKSQGRNEEALSLLETCCQLFAIALDLKINTDPTRIITLEFIDGSIAHTYGVIPEVEWRFDEDEVSAQQHRSTSASKPKMVQEWDFGLDASPQETYICDFYVLEQLTSPVILCSDLLLGSNAFAACAKNFYQTSRLGKRRIEDFDMCYIREKKAQRSWREVVLRRPAKNNDPAPVTAAQAWETELRRRGDEADRIAEVPPHERATAQKAENRRIQQWDVTQAPQQNQQTPAYQSTSGSQAQPQSTNTQSGSTSPQSEINGRR